jgi:hypothetical protein
MKRVALLILTCALSACSNSSNPYNPGTPAPGNGNQNAPGQGAPGNSALTQSAWCSPYHNQGSDYQFRLSLTDTLTYETHIYSLAAGGRGPEVTAAQSHGSYQINGAAVTMTDSGGGSATYTMRLDPADAVTGAKKLHLTDASGEMAFDPCI